MSLHPCAPFQEGNHLPSCWWFATQQFTNGIDEKAPDGSVWNDWSWPHQCLPQCWISSQSGRTNSHLYPMWLHQGNSPFLQHVELQAYFNTHGAWSPVNQTVINFTKSSTSTMRQLESWSILLQQPVQTLPMQSATSADLPVDGIIPIGLPSNTYCAIFKLQPTTSLSTAMCQCMAWKATSMPIGRETAITANPQLATSSALVMQPSLGRARSNQQLPSLLLRPNTWVLHKAQKKHYTYMHFSLNSAINQLALLLFMRTIRAAFLLPSTQFIMLTQNTWTFNSTSFVTEWTSHPTAVHLHWGELCQHSDKAAVLCQVWEAENSHWSPPYFQVSRWAPCKRVSVPRKAPRYQCAHDNSPSPNHLCSP